MHIGAKGWTACRSTAKDTEPRVKNTHQQLVVERDVELLRVQEVGREDVDGAAGPVHLARTQRACAREDGARRM